MVINLQDLLVSDALLSCLLLLCLTVLSLKFLPFDFSNLRKASFAWRGAAFGAPQSKHTRRYRERALSAFYFYEELAVHDIKQMRKSYAKLGRAHKRIGYELGYPQKLERLPEVTSVNAVVTKAIAKVSMTEDGMHDVAVQFPAETADLAKVREALKHFVRDWSSDGALERSRIINPIIEVLSSVERERTGGLKVLVPGSGLGRLAWEINKLGFDTTANEMSPFMNFAFRFLLSPDSTQSISQHVIHPFAHWFSHQRSNTALFRSIYFPDALPRLSDSFHLVEGDFLQLDPPARKESADGYDYIVTLFFIDTSLNILSTLEQIHRLLRPGGLWINLGPLLWTNGSQASLELSLDELLSLVDKIGFEVDLASRKTVECEYTADREAMMRWIYMAEFWTAAKRF